MSKKVSRSTPKRKRRKNRRCAGCNGQQSTRIAKYGNRHTYEILRRGDPLSGRRFCTLTCLETYLKKKTKGQLIVANESYKLRPKLLCIHTVLVREVTKKKKVTTEVTEMGD